MLQFRSLFNRIEGLVCKTKDNSRAASVTLPTICHDDGQHHVDSVMLETIVFKTSFYSMPSQNTTILDYVACRGTDYMEELIIIGKEDGKRPRGHSPRRWSDQVSEELQMPIKIKQKTAVN
ncbi:unnamed protein product [Diatraea saccharalis]|uniref:Uncharacterized protein n=1 Tax=Diatraea saccharalis TaxID=40085 RepID=A0A9N9RA78_9NEOP|nr:unnamed protein product [Diatraea saccharalis]